MSKRLGEGSPGPLGVTVDARGANVAIFSAHAAAIDLCLFDASGQKEIERLRLPERTGDIFHGHVEGLQIGTRYGLRAHGDFAPTQGHRFNAAKLLVDPHARLLDRQFRLHPSMFAYPAGTDDLQLDSTDSAPFMPKGIVTASPGSRIHAPLTRWSDTILYELHVRSFTRRHPHVPAAVRGTFAGLRHPAAIEHLVKLGITTVELMPLAAWIEERHLLAAGLENYWGYNPVAFSAPDPRLAPGGWDEIRLTIAELASAGIETIVDVVLNHTGEGDELGPTLSLRGLDNASYYRLRADDPRFYADDSGCGNTLALDRAPVVRLAMDAMRAWVRHAGVHGFRFDLATSLARRADGFDAHAPLLAAIQQDPELAGLKLIAEPWDIGLGGYQLGRFPAAWGEWNDRFRDDVRRFWRGDQGYLGALATRLAGSADVFAKRPASRGINFVTAHDGFTLADLVSYSVKRNAANGEANRDGSNNNHSWNNGHEGPSDDLQVLSARRRDQRALLATLILARGTPMISMGAELGQSAHGNNNCYAQDNELSWLDWDNADQSLIRFVATLTEARRNTPLVRGDLGLTGDRTEDWLPHVEWLSPEGSPLLPADWDAADGGSLVMLLGESGDRVALLIHRGANPRAFRLPEPAQDRQWQLVVDSAADLAARRLSGSEIAVAPRSVMLFAERATLVPKAS